MQQGVYAYLPQERVIFGRPAAEAVAGECERLAAERVFIVAAHTLAARAIVVFTRSGSTARLISKYRPPCPVYAFCHEESVARRAALYWGVIPIPMPLELDQDATIAQAETELLRRRCVGRGDILAVAAGAPGQPGQTNLMKLVRVGGA